MITLFIYSFENSNILQLKGGKNVLQFQKAAQKSFNPLLFLSIVGAITSNTTYLHKARSILLMWSRGSPLPGISLAATKKHKGGISLCGLMISRLLDRIIESYHILASCMTHLERCEVLDWLKGLGKTIKLSHEYWLNHHEIEGPSNHHAWHSFGMVLIGIETSDETLISYALQDPENTWSYNNLLCWAIHNEERTCNMFRKGHNSKGESFSYDEVAQTGEIFDRYRSRCEDKPPCGLHYALFSLRALVYTAHLIVRNRLNIGRSFENPYNLHHCALIKALHYYGNFFVSFPACTPSDIHEEPYRGQQLDENALVAFLLAAEDTPHDLSISNVVCRNIVQAEPIQEQLAGGKARFHFPVMQHPHPLNIPMCYVILVQSLEVFDLEHTKIGY